MTGEYLSKIHHWIRIKLMPGGKQSTPRKIKKPINYLRNTKNVEGIFWQ